MAKFTFSETGSRIRLFIADYAMKQAEKSRNFRGWIRVAWCARHNCNSLLFWLLNLTGSKIIYKRLYGA